MLERVRLRAMVLGRWMCRRSSKKERLASEGGGIPEGEGSGKDR
jgi:hypothetical protein